MPSQQNESSIESPARDSLTRTGRRELWRLIGVASLAFAGLVVLLGWLAALTGGGAAASRAVDIERGAITLYLRAEPPTLDSTRGMDQINNFVFGHVMEGLLRYGPDNAIVPGVAERWEILDEGATFWLREDARWSDGRPVTAQDFVFAWRKVVDPDNASQYAFMMFHLRNAEAVNRRELPLDALGVRAVSDRILEVEFARPVSFFEKIVAGNSFLPIREDFYLSRDGRYAADAGDLLYNGPFTITRWVHGAHLRFEKNSHYWDRDSIRLNVIDMPYMTSDTRTLFNLFKDGAIATTTLGSEQLEEAMSLRWHLGRYDDGGLFYLDFNFRPGRLTNNYHLRKAMQRVNDSGELVYKVIALPGYRPAASVFPSWLQGAEAPLWQEYPPPAVTPDLAIAREHLALAKQELGLTTLPPLVLLAGDTPISDLQAEYYQNLFMRTLGIELRIDKQIFKQRLDKMFAGEFDIVLAGWGPDFNDPLTYGDLYASWNSSNHSRYNNPELDRQVQIAQSSLDPRTRMDAFGEIQRIVIEQAVQLPNYERGILFVQVPELKGAIHRAVGTDPDYTRAYLEAAR